MRVLVLAAAASIALVVFSACSGGGSRPQYTYDVQTFDDQLEPLREAGLTPAEYHFPAGQVYEDYNSNPPTSGPHAPPAPWGVSDTPLPKEVPVHNMEHGGVVIWYNCDDGPKPLDEAACTQLRDKLATVTEKAIDDRKLVLMLPYADMENRIALTAWTKLDAFDEFDQDRVALFIDAFDRLYNPEGF